MEWILSLFFRGHVREAEHPSSTHAQKKFWILTIKCGNNLEHENEAKGLVYLLVSCPTLFARREPREKQSVVILPLL
jgi:hypothetical protein